MSRCDDCLFREPGGDCWALRDGAQSRELTDGCCWFEPVVPDDAADLARFVDAAAAVALIRARRQALNAGAN
jgi:hypothetical protein